MRWEGSETIMEASVADRATDDGIVHSFWKQKVAKEPGDSGAIPGPATLRFTSLA